MGDAVQDIDVSSGTCYFAENSETKGDFIPCGNVAHGHWPCCHVGDMCLGVDEANACWNAATGNTYLAGCTDPGFNSRVCPWKSPEFHEQEWVAIQQCDKGTGENDTKWGGCKIDEESTELVRLPHTSCDPYCSSPIYIGTSGIPAFASLPAHAGQSIQWMSGFDPAATPATSTRGSRSSTGTTSPTSKASASSSLSTPPAASTTPPPTAPPAPVSGEDSGLSTGAKAGIGVGAAGAVLLLVAVVCLALLVRQRRRMSDRTVEHSHNQHDTAPEQTGYNNKSQQQPLVAQLPDANPYAGYKVELPAENRRAYQAELSADQTIVLGGGSAVTVAAGGLSPHASPNPSSLTAYSPDLTYSDTSPSLAASPGQVSPQITGGRHWHDGQPHSNPGSMGRVSELRG